MARDTVEVARRLWRERLSSYDGERCGLSQARITMAGRMTFPSGLRPGGEKMCRLTGEVADMANVMVKADLGEGFALVDQGSAGQGSQTHAGLH